eukprot:s2220_g13.t2
MGCVSASDFVQEFSVVYTSRALNHMSTKFQKVMRDVSTTLKTVYNAHSAVLLPGSGTFAMEAVARHFGTKRKCLVIRNGYFSYRWSQIFEAGSLPATERVLKARPSVDPSVSMANSSPSYAPPPLQEVLSVIEEERPDTVFAPHVETSAGIMLPDEYIQAVSEAVHSIGGFLVLDCIASGCIWEPYTQWIVLLSRRARDHLDNTSSESFALDLRRWAAVMEAYENGGHMYHTTMPTDAITRFRDVQQELAAYGFERARREQVKLGDAVRNMLNRYGFKSVAAEGYAAPGVIVAYTKDPDMKSGAKFAALGIQIAAGVPLMVDEFTQSSDFQTFRLGLFGIDKLRAIDTNTSQLERAISNIYHRGRPAHTKVVAPLSDVIAPNASAADIWSTEELLQSLSDSNSSEEVLQTFLVCMSRARLDSFAPDGRSRAVLRHSTTPGFVGYNPRSAVADARTTAI